MSAGLLNCSIDLYSPAITSGSMGETIATYTKVATVRAHKRTMRLELAAIDSAEKVLAMAQTGSVVHIFRIRYRSDVTSAWKIVQDGRHMALISPPMEDDFHRGRPIWMLIKVREIN